MNSKILIFGKGVTDFRLVSKRQIIFSPTQKKFNYSFSLYFGGQSIMQRNNEISWGCMYIDEYRLCMQANR